MLAQLGDADKSKGYWERFSALKHETDEHARQVRADYDSLAISKRSVAQTHTDVGRVYVLNHRPKEAEELWLQAAALDPGSRASRLSV